MRSTAHRVRAAALLAAGALAVHELRYALVPGGEAAGASHAHGYLALATPAVAGLLAAVLGLFLARLARGGAAHAGSATFGRRWAAAAGALAAIFVMQEGLEAALAAGRPSAAAGVLAHGGWLALPLAAGLGAVIAGLLRAADAAVALVAAARPAPIRGRWSSARGAWRPARFLVVQRGGLPRRLAGRAPPVATPA